MNNQSVCYPINTMIATRGKALGRGTGFGVGDDGDAQFTLSTAHEHAVCYDKTIAIEGNGVRESHLGAGYAESDAMYTLNTVEQHSVCYPEVSRTLSARHDSSPCIDRGQEMICYPETFQTLTANNAGGAAENARQSKSERDMRKG